MTASVQDRDGAKPTLLSLFHTVGVRFVLADGGFAGVVVDWCHRILATTLSALAAMAEEPAPMSASVDTPAINNFRFMSAAFRAADR